MRNVYLGTSLLAAALFTTAAGAAGWTDFSSAFSERPCSDGWAGCVVDGKAVSAEMSVGSSGVPMPSAMRVDWFNLRGSSSFSPFPALSSYTGALVIPTADAPVEQVATNDNPVTKVDSGQTAPNNDQTGNSGTADPEVRDTTPDTQQNAGTETVDTNTTTETNSLANTGSNTGTATVTTDTKPQTIIAKDDVKVPVVTPPVNDGDCKNYRALEPKAMMGKLTPGATKCLEGLLAATSKQTDKDKISRILMTNAYSSGDKKLWEKLVKRHLDEIDRSDPDICYKYAFHLAKKGTSASYGVIKWADVALENRTVWTGSTYTTRVNSLYRLRAIAAQRLWKAAETKMASDSSEANAAARDKVKNMTKVMAREWYEYASKAGKDASKAKALCVSAAGTEDYCEGA